MQKPIAISLKDIRGIKTAKSPHIDSSREQQQKQPNSFIRAYLQGASHRLKFKKKENEFANYFREGNDRLYKFNREDQLLNMRKKHLHKYEQGKHDCSIDVNQKSLDHTNLHTIQSQNLKLITDSSSQLLELIYIRSPVIELIKHSTLIPISQTKEHQYKKQKYIIENKKVSKDNMFRNKNDKTNLFVDSIRYGSVPLDILEPKQIINQSFRKPSIPITLDGTKKLLKQYL